MEKFPVLVGSFSNIPMLFEAEGLDRPSPKEHSYLLIQEPIDLKINREMTASATKRTNIGPSMDNKNETEIVAEEKKLITNHSRKELIY